ncbi:MAG: hypothetical protein MSD68_10655, partial [Blautia sp.]|nr:hypothetical protein [Blautia sp.]
NITSGRECPRKRVHMGTVSKNRGMSCVGVRKTGTTLIRVSTVMGTLYKARAVSEQSIFVKKDEEKFYGEDERKVIVS